MENKKNKVGLIYCRVSSNKQAQEGDSLESQETDGLRTAVAKGVSIHPTNGVWKEQFSGRKDSRPVFDEMMRFIKNNNGDIHYLIIRDIDRLTRGGSDSYGEIKKRLTKYGVEILDSKGIVQPVINTLADLNLTYPWSEGSPSESSEKMMADMGRAEVNKMLTRLIRCQVLLTREGFQIGQANEGYLNKRIYVDGKKRMIQVPDPEKAKFFIKMFEMRASELYTDEQIVDKINKMGFISKIKNFWNKEHTKIVNKKGAHPLSVKRLQEIIKKPIYCGVICEKWTKNKPVRAKYDGLVSIDTFNKANRGRVFIQKNSDQSLEICYDYKPEKNIQKKNRHNPDYPFKNIVCCPDCHRPLLGSASTGKSGKKYPCYHCARGHRRFSISATDLRKLIEIIINGLEIDVRILNALKIVIKDTYAKRSKEVEECLAATENNIKQLCYKQNEILDAIKKTTSDGVRVSLEKEYEVLSIEIKEIEQRTPKEMVSERKIDNFIKSAVYLMEHREELLLNTNNFNEMHRLYSLVFDESPTYQDLVNGTLKLSPIFVKTKELANANSSLVGAQGFEPWTPSV